MTPVELKAARETFGLTQAGLARTLQVSLRAVSGWEQGHRDGRPHTIPPPVALLIKFALKYPDVRRELGVNS